MSNSQVVLMVVLALELVVSPWWAMAAPLDDSDLADLCKRLRSGDREKLQLQGLSVGNYGMDLIMIESNNRYDIPLTKRYVDLEVNYKMALFDRGGNENDARKHIRSLGKWYGGNWSSLVDIFRHGPDAATTPLEEYNLIRVRYDGMYAEALYQHRYDPDAPVQRLRFADLPPGTPTDELMPGAVVQHDRMYRDWQDWVAPYQSYYARVGTHALRSSVYNWEYNRVFQDHLLTDVPINYLRVRRAEKECVFRVSDDNSQLWVDDTPRDVPWVPGFSQLKPLFGALPNFEQVQGFVNRDAIGMLMSNTRADQAVYIFNVDVLSKAVLSWSSNKLGEGATPRNLPVKRISFKDFFVCHEQDWRPVKDEADDEAKQLNHSSQARVSLKAGAAAERRRRTWTRILLAVGVAVAALALLYCAFMLKKKKQSASGSNKLTIGQTRGKSTTLPSSSSSGSVKQKTSSITATTAKSPAASTAPSRSGTTR